MLLLPPPHPPPPSSQNTLGGSLLNQTVGVPGPEQHISILTLGFNQDIHAPALDSYILAPPSSLAVDYYISTLAIVHVLDNYIPALVIDPWLGQDICPLPTPTIDQNISFSF